MAELTGTGGPLRLGVSSGALYPVPTEDVPALAARGGFTDLEIMLQTAGEYESGFTSTLRERCDANGCRVHAVHVWNDFHPLLNPYRRRADEGRAMFSRAIAAAAMLDARVVVWHGPKRGEVDSREGRDAFLRAAVDLGRACASVGMKLAIENVSWCALATTREVAAFAARLPDVDPGRNVGFAFDPFQAAEAKQNPFMLLAAMGDRVFDVHLSDSREDDPSSRHLPPGEGDLPWPALIRAIAHVYAGPMMLEGVVGERVNRLDQARAALDPLIAAAARDLDDPCAGDPPPGVCEGIMAFNNREFYEAHETIEHEWHAEPGAIRRLYQGILQIGVGFLHAKRGNHAGALLLLQDGIEKTAAFTPRCLGIETGQLVIEAQRCLDRLRTLGPSRLDEFDFDAIPLIKFTPGGPGNA
jgi:uncharacterized protein